jgi:hypothetical protein
MFVTKCPACGTDSLEVVGGAFHTQGMRLFADGFSFTDAKQVDTEGETVMCINCGKLFALDELMTDDPPADETHLKLKG